MIEMVTSPYDVAVPHTRFLTVLGVREAALHRPRECGKLTPAGPANAGS